MSTLTKPMLVEPITAGFYTVGFCLFYLKLAINDLMAALYIPHVSGQPMSLSTLAHKT